MTEAGLLDPPRVRSAAPVLLRRLSRALLPRTPVLPADWADKHRKLSSKASSQPGDWRTSRNPPQREPMNAMAPGTGVREMVLKWPIQFGKSEVECNILGFAMCEDPGPIMVCLPGEVSQQKWINQKLNPLIDETDVVRNALVSVASRDSSNTRSFKDFAGGQLYIEHAGSPQRLKQTSVKWLLVDEFSQFASALTTGDDPHKMLDGRTSAFPFTSRKVYIGTPEIKGTCRVDYLWDRSDQRRYHIACPHCSHEQHMEWGALQWAAHPGPDGRRQVWLVCADCGAMIFETHKTAMIRAGRWIAGNPGAKRRGYHINCLYYPVGIGPSWADLVEEWLEAQGDPAKLKTFINDRLAECWEDATTRNVNTNVVAERAEPYALRWAPDGVLRITAGVDTQDNRLAVQIIGWGERLTSWVLDYVELPGDPALDDVWIALAQLLNTPILHACGATLQIEASAIDMGGHRTEAVKAWVRGKHVRRPMAIHGAIPHNAPVLGKGKAMDVTWRGQTDRRGVVVYQVGTVNIKHLLFSRLATDADLHVAWQKQTEAERPVAPPISAHFSADLPDGYFPGLISEIFDPSKNRFVKRRGSVRNEPLDTWGYAYAAAHHPELRLHRATVADWQRMRAQLLARAPGTSTWVAPEVAAPPAHAQPAAEPQVPPKKSFWHQYPPRGLRR